MSLEMFTRYAPQEWQKLHQEGQPIPQVHELARLVSLNDRLSQADVATIYAPMIHYLDMMMTYQQAYQSANPTSLLSLGFQGVSRSARAQRPGSYTSC